MTFEEKKDLLWNFMEEILKDVEYKEEEMIPLKEWFDQSRDKMTEEKVDYCINLYKSFKKNHDKMEPR